MSRKKHRQSPRERILATALDLFYRQGYGATGLNQLIAEADVARASFYDHFQSKEDLLITYASELSRRDLAEVRKEVQSQTTARARFFCPFDILERWLEATSYRGCPFQNMMAEVPPGASQVHEIVRQHQESVRIGYQEMALDLKRAESEFSHIDPESVALAYTLVFEGAIATAVAYRATWPVEEGRKVIVDLLAKRSG